MKNVSKIFVAASVLLVSACGGGGGGSTNNGTGGGTPPSLPITASVSGVPAEVNELSDYTFTVTVTNAKNTPQIKFVSSVQEINISQVDQQTFTLKTADVDRDSRVTIQMHVTDGQDTARTFVTNINTKVINNSFEPEIRVVNYLLFDRERFLTAKDENALLVVLRNLVLLAEPIAKGDAVWSKVGIPAPVALEVALNSLKSTLDNYQKGLIINNEIINESKVRAAVTQVKKELEYFMVYYSDAINAELEVLGDLMPGNLKATHFIVDPDNQVSSFFVGNTAFGAYDSNGSWQYGTSYRFMNNIVTRNCSQ